MSDTDTIYLRIKKLLPDLHALAKELYAFCPDIVDQVTGALEGMGEGVSESLEVFFVVGVR